MLCLRINSTCFKMNKYHEEKWQITYSNGQFAEKPKMHYKSGQLDWFNVEDFTEYNKYLLNSTHECIYIYFIAQQLK